MRKSWALLLLVIIVVLVPALALANHRAPNTNIWSISILQGPLVVCGGNYAGGSTANLPLCSNLCDLVAEFIQIVYFIMGVALWIILPISFAIGGIMFLVSRGNSGETSKARAWLTNSIIGLVVMLCAWLILSVFVSFFNLSKFIPFFSGGGGFCINPPAAPVCGGSTLGTCSGSGSQTCVLSNGSYSCQSTN